MCLADYCDILRCEVLATQEMKDYLNGPNQMNTDIEIWREATAYKTALTLSGPRELIKVFPKGSKSAQGKKFKSILSSPSPPLAENRCPKVNFYIKETRAF